MKGDLLRILLEALLPLSIIIFVSFWFNKFSDKWSKRLQKKIDNSQKKTEKELTENLSILPKSPLNPDGSINHEDFDKLRKKKFHIWLEADESSNPAVNDKKSASLFDDVNKQD